MILYANMSDENMDILDNDGGGYLTQVNVDENTFVLKVYADDEKYIKKNLTIKRTDSPEIELKYDIIPEGSNIYGIVPVDGWKENSIYNASLAFGYEEVQFIYFDTNQDKSVDNYTIVTRTRDKRGIDLNKAHGIYQQR